MGSDFEDRVAPNNYPPAQRTLNSPGINKTDWDVRLKTEDWRDRAKVGSIYPVDLRSYDTTTFSNVIENKTQFI